MTDTDDSNNEKPCLCIETQVLNLLQHPINEEQTANQQAREERDLPLEITSFLNSLTKKQHLDKFKRYKREVSKYYNEEWTVTEDINKSFLPNLKAFTVDTTQVVNVHYKRLEISPRDQKSATGLIE
ncbi:hypothetical protein G6F62_004434 [Rhizopus arrhizus]|nr:hypothetical protein G6F62_004434 [Rhizopus arrhizus]